MSRRRAGRPAFYRLIRAVQATIVEWSGQIAVCGPATERRSSRRQPMREDERSMHDFTDVTYEVQDGLAWIIINRPERYNSFRARTVDQLVRAFKRAWGSNRGRVLALTGAGDKAFCTG